MQRYFFASSIADFLDRADDETLGTLAANNPFPLETTQRDAWVEQVRLLRSELRPFAGGGRLYFEYSIPRLGKRIDVVAVIGPAVFVVEFKVGESTFPVAAVDQVWDYALDLKNFHETSHRPPVIPVLVATAATTAGVVEPPDPDGTFRPIRCGGRGLGDVIAAVLPQVAGPPIDADAWEGGRYRPTPTIVEAASALYNGHTVAEISRSDAGAMNLSRTSRRISEVIRAARDRSAKAICLVTGVPGAGKTFVGLDVATTHVDPASELHSVYLSGNGPLVAVLRESLTRDRLAHERERGRKRKKGEVMSEVKLFVQNVHHFRDECLVDADRPPVEHVAIFDEAQRAWDREQTSTFMRTKKGQAGFDRSEPEFLLSCLDRHPDWAVVVCLVGGGQEINTGEAGIREWVDALVRSFPDWRVHLSSRITDAEFAADEALRSLEGRPGVVFDDDLHLAVPMRSFRSERVARFVKALLDREEAEASALAEEIGATYPIVVTRDVGRAKRWLRGRSRGSERYGIVSSSQALRLKPYAIDVKSPTDPVHWFLEGKEDIRSSYYCEDVATEFHVQGLELDWTCVTWDADFRWTGAGWEHWSFRGDRWTRIRKPQKQTYLKNAYRVLLTRARQGLVIFVPPGDPDDPTRDAAYYDPTFKYLKRVGLREV